MFRVLVLQHEARSNITVLNFANADFSGISGQNCFCKFPKNKILFRQTDYGMFYLSLWPTYAENMSEIDFSSCAA
jgi:hypothetical protein